MDSSADDALHDLDQAVRRVAAVDDPVDRAIQATAFMSALAHAGDDIKNVRREAMLELQSHGYGYGAIADMVGVSKARVQQILAGLTPPSRPGRIEVDARLEAVRLRTEGASDAAVAAALVPSIRTRRGGSRLTHEQIAAMIDVPLSVVRTADRKRSR